MRNDFTLHKIVITNALATLPQVRHAMWATQESRHTWLEELSRTGELDESRYAACVSRGLYVPLCDVRRLARIPAHVLARIPVDLAAEHRILPIGLEADGDLRVVTDDPTDRPGFEEVQFFAECRLLREVAVPSAIDWVLFQYYGVASMDASIATVATHHAA